MPFCPNCRDEFEDWVEICPDCRVALVDELPPLPKTPFPPPVFKETYERFINCRWLHHTLIVVATALILLVLLISQPWSNYSDEDFVNYNVKIKSGQMDVFSRNAYGEEEHIIEISWVYPNRYRGKYLSYDKRIEFIIIKNKYYSKDTSAETLLYDARFHETLSQIRYIYDKAKNQLLDSLMDIRKLPDESIYGINCLHYTARVDMNYEVDRIIAEYEAMQQNNPESSIAADEEWLRDLQFFRNAIMEVEYWISEDDGTIRQLIIKTHELSLENKIFMKDSHTRSVYYNINRPVAINSPEIIFGMLLPGWYLEDRGRYIQ
jgi:hypothetical protein